MQCKGCSIHNFVRCLVVHDFYVNAFLTQFDFLSSKFKAHTTQRGENIFNSYTRWQKKSLTTHDVHQQRQQNKKHSGTRLYIFISTSYIAFFFIVNEAMKTFERCCYMAQKRKLCVDILYDDVNGALE